MGRTFHFECPRCQYKARVSGGADRGVNCCVQTIACQDCRALHDVFTRLRQRETEETPAAAAQRENARKSGGLLPGGIVIPPLVLVENPFRRFDPGNRPVAVRVRSRWVPVKPGCPVAAWHRIERWNNPGRCPRCGAYLERNLTPWRVWD